MHHNGPEIVGCPECAAPAEVVDRFVLGSTAGPIEHVIVLCIERHRFTVPVVQVVSRAVESRPTRWTQRL
jgi:hypothetical protein